MIDKDDLKAMLCALAVGMVAAILSWVIYSGVFVLFFWIEKAFK